jgi:hypothetical protein
MALSGQSDVRFYVGYWGKADMAETGRHVA